MNTITLAQNDFLDVLFDSRNKDYGAYALRRHYERRMRNAIGITAALLVGLSAAYVASNMMATPVTHTAMTIKALPPMTDIKLPEKETPVVQPPPPARASTPPAALPSVRDVTVKVVPDNTANITPPPTQAEMKNHSISTVNSAGDLNGAENAVADLGSGSASGVKLETHDGAGESEKPFTFVEQMPSFPGGEAALAKFLNNNIRYPSLAQENGISGMVSVQFVVDATGMIQDIKIAGAAKGGGLEQEAMRVIRKMPNWKPGRQNGKNVAVYFTLPIRFTLADQQ